MAEEIAFLQKELEGGDKDSQEVYTCSSTYSINTLDSSIHCSRLFDGVVSTRSCRCTCILQH
jgi:hypothetical protein